MRPLWEDGEELAAPRNWAARHARRRELSVVSSRVRLLDVLDESDTPILVSSERAVPAPVEGADDPGKLLVTEAGHLS